MPFDGRWLPDASWLLKKAMSRSMSIAITSPVDFISGVSVTSTPGNFTNGKTASLTAVYGSATSSVNPMSFSFSPAMQRAA